MNQDNEKTGQQGYGQDPASQQQPQGQQQQQQPFGQQQDQQNAQSFGGDDSTGGVNGDTSDGALTGDAGSASTGQASYGNSGESDTLTQSQNPSDLGQQSDMGQDHASKQGSSGFVGSQSSGNDLGSGGLEGQTKDGLPLGSAGGGYGGSADTNSQTSGESSSSGPASSSGADFADQGQGAMNEDLMGSDDDADSGTTDIETERSQGRENDIEGSSL